MTEQNSKGIALVILGIVAIIAIVGLVLLFTGAKKSTGEFVVPVAKEYGGAIKGVASPYDRAFVGRSYDWDASGINEELSGYGDMGDRGYAGGAVYMPYGENPEQTHKKTESFAISSDKLQQNFHPSKGYGKACQGASETAKTLVNHPELQKFAKYTEFKSNKRVNPSYAKDGVQYGVGDQGEECVLANDMLSYIGAKSRGATSMGLTYSLDNDGRPAYCCVNVGLDAQGGKPYTAIY